MPIQFNDPLKGSPCSQRVNSIPAPPSWACGYVPNFAANTSVSLPYNPVHPSKTQTDATNSRYNFPPISPSPILIPQVTNVFDKGNVQGYYQHSVHHSKQSSYDAQLVTKDINVVDFLQSNIPNLTPFSLPTAPIQRQDVEFNAEVNKKLSGSQNCEELKTVATQCYSRSDSLKTENQFPDNNSSNCSELASVTYTYSYPANWMPQPFENIMTACDKAKAASIICKELSPSYSAVNTGQSLKSDYTNHSLPMTIYDFTNKCKKDLMDQEFISDTMDESFKEKKAKYKKYHLSSINLAILGTSTIAQGTVNTGLDMKSEHSAPYLSKTSIHKVSESSKSLISNEERTSPWVTPMNIEISGIGSNAESRSMSQETLPSLHSNFSSLANNAKQEQANLYRQPASKVLDFLYLGSFNDAEDTAFLHANNIKTVISVGSKTLLEGSLPSHTHRPSRASSQRSAPGSAASRAPGSSAASASPAGSAAPLSGRSSGPGAQPARLWLRLGAAAHAVEALHFPADDIAAFPIDAVLERCFGALSRLRERHWRAPRGRAPCALIHCDRGISRSPTVVLAYLMLTNGWTVSEAFHYVYSKRRIIEPNVGFMDRLKKYESLLRCSDSRVKYCEKKKRGLVCVLRNVSPDINEHDIVRFFEANGGLIWTVQKWSVPSSSNLSTGFDTQYNPNIDIHSGGKECLKRYKNRLENSSPNLSHSMHMNSIYINSKHISSFPTSPTVKESARFSFKEAQGDIQLIDG